MNNVRSYLSHYGPKHYGWTSFSSEEAAVRHQQTLPEESRKGVTPSQEVDPGVVMDHKWGRLDLPRPTTADNIMEPWPMPPQEIERLRAIVEAWSP